MNTTKLEWTEVKLTKVEFYGDQQQWKAEANGVCYIVTLYRGQERYAYYRLNISFTNGYADITEDEISVRYDNDQNAGKDRAQEFHDSIERLLINDPVRIKFYKLLKAMGMNDSRAWTQFPQDVQDLAKSVLDGYEDPDNE